MYPAKTADNVAADTGIAVETVQKMLDRVTAPSVANYTRLWFRYGPEFLLAVHPQAPPWLGRAHHEEEQVRIRAQIAALEAHLARRGQ